MTPKDLITPIPASVHQSRLYKGDNEPCDCHSCGRMATDENPARFVDDIWIDCPSCGPVMPESTTTVRTEAERLRADVRDLFAEAADLGSGRSSSNGRRAPSKPKHRVERRYEQEPTSFAGRMPKQTIKVVKYENATERVGVAISSEMHEALRLECRFRTLTDGEPVPMAVLIREAIVAHCARIDQAPPKLSTVDKEQVWLRMPKQERQALDLAAKHWKRTLGECAEACLVKALGLEQDENFASSKVQSEV